MNDIETAAFLTASSWERMSTLCEEHKRADLEHTRATLEDFIMPSLESQVRLMVATVALQRAEGRLSR